MNKDDIIISGVHLDLTEAIKNMVKEKADKLLRHNDHIVRIKIELKCEEHKGISEFIAQGHLEVRGPDMVVSASTDDLYKSIDQLILKLDRKLRRRARILKVKRKAAKAIEIPAALPKVT